MALLKPKLLFDVAKRAIGTSKVLGAGHWNKDWKPGDYPTTEEQMAAAAKKYGLMREEYKPIPDDGDGAGDYPDFKKYSVEGRDIHYPWDFPEYRRNYKEVMHEDFNIYTEDRYNCEVKLRYPMWYMLSCFLGVMGVNWLLSSNSENTFFIPAMAKQIPREGITHYKYPETK